MLLILHHTLTKEADTCILLHVNDTARNGIKHVMLCTVDTDAVVVNVSCMDQLYLHSLWIAFGAGKHFRYIAINELSRSLGPQKS